jgi:hypothetical protein
MSTHITFRKAIAAVALSTAIGLTSLVGGSAFADGPCSVPSEPIYWTITLENSTAQTHEYNDRTMIKIPEKISRYPH